MALIMPNGSYTVNKPFAQPFGAPPGSTPSKPGPGRPSAPMQPQGMAPSKPAGPMPQYGQPGGMTPSKPGPARPSVPMMQNYAPGQAKPQQSPYATATPYGGQAGGQQAPGYGSPQGQRGQMRTADFRDRDGDRVDDRDQDGAGMPAYGRPSQPQQSPYATSTPYAQPRPPIQLADPRIAEAGIMAGEGGFRQPPNGPAAPQVFNRYGPGTSPEYMQQNPDTEPFNPAANRPPLYGSIYAPGATAEDIERAGPDALPPPAQPSLTQYMAPGNPLPGPMSRPAPFQSTTRNFDGTTSEMPNFQQRDAFIGQINNQLGQMQNQSWRQPGMGAPQFDFPTMWGQAGEMAQQGFQNPFAAQDPGNQIRRLMSPTATPGGGINQNAPPGGSGMPDFAVLKAPGSPGDRVPRPALSPAPDPAVPLPPAPAPPVAPRPVGRPTSGSNSFSIERLAADPNLTPSQKAAKFLEANRESIKNGTFRHADIDALGLPSTDARLLKNKVNTQTLSFDRLRKAKEVSKMFPNYGIPQSAYAAFAKKYG